MLLPSKLLYLGFLQPFLLLLHLRLQLVFLVLLIHELIEPLFVLSANELCLLSFFFFVEHDGILYFSLLLLTFVPYTSNSVPGLHFLHLLHLLLLHFLMDFFIVFLFKFHHITSSLFCFFNFFPSFHFFLF